MKKLLIPVFAAAACFACEKTIDIDVPTEQSKLVLNGYLNPDSTFKVQLTKSAFVLEDYYEQPEVAGATVTLFENEEAVGQLEYLQHGWYELPGFYPEAGKTYRLEAEKTGFEKISATETVLPPVPVLELGMDTVWANNEGSSQPFLEISLTIQDPPGENYYVPMVWYSFKGTYTDPYSNNSVEIEESYPIYLEEGSPDPFMESYCYNYCAIIINDSFFDGKNYTLKLRGHMRHFPQGWEIKEEKLSVNLYHVSPSYYLYQATLKRNYESDGDPFAEPSPVYSNVEGGYGILGSLSPGNH